MTTLVYETTCRSPRFEPDGPDLARQVQAAANAGSTVTTPPTYSSMMPGGLRSWIWPWRHGRRGRSPPSRLVMTTE